MDFMVKNRLLIKISTSFQTKSKPCVDIQVVVGHLIYIEPEIIFSRYKIT